MSALFNHVLDICRPGSMAARPLVAAASPSVSASGRERNEADIRAAFRALRAKIAEAKAAAVELAESPEFIGGSMAIHNLDLFMVCLDSATVCTLDAEAEALEALESLQ